MRKRLDGRWAKQWRAAAGLGLLLFTQCSQQGPAPAERADTSRQSAALSVNDWPLETLTATNSIALEDRATLTGNAVVTKQATGAVLAFNAELALGFDAVLTGSVKSDTLVLKDRAIITGTAHYNNVTSTGTIQGGGSSPLALPLFSIPTLPTATPGSQDITLTSSQQQTRAAGAYRDVLLNSGNAGTPTRLTLSGGLYHFKSLTVLNDAGVQCSAACEIRVQGRVAVGDRSFLKPQSGVPGLGVGNVELLIGGGNGAAGPTGWPAALEVNNDGQLRAYTLAPNGTARLGHRVVLQGKVVARDVLVGFDSDAEGLQLPLISTQPVDVTVREDQPASFSVAVSNPAGVTYRWQRGGVDIAGTAGAGATYTLAHAPVSADGAQFRVKVTNAAGTVTSNAATLHVIPCEDTDTTCDAFDDDCNGVNDEDFGPKCNLEGGTAVLHCGGGNVFAVPCTNGNACDGAEFCENASCHDGPDLVVDDGNPCTADSCVHPGGVQHELLPEGTSCSDEDFGNGLCDDAGSCVPKPGTGGERPGPLRTDRGAPPNQRVAANFRSPRFDPIAGESDTWTPRDEEITFAPPAPEGARLRVIQDPGLALGPGDCPAGQLEPYALVTANGHAVSTPLANCTAGSCVGNETLATLVFPSALSSVPLQLSLREDENPADATTRLLVVQQGPAVFGPGDCPGGEFIPTASVIVGDILHNPTDISSCADHCELGRHFFANGASSAEIGLKLMEEDQLADAPHRLDVFFPEVSVVTGGGPICDPRSEPYARMFLNGVRTDFDIPVPAQPGAVKTLVLPPGDPALELKIEIWEHDNDIFCDRTSGDHELTFGPFLLPLTSPQTTGLQCGTGSDEVVHICSRAELTPEGCNSFELNLGPVTIDLDSGPFVTPPTCFDDPAGTDLRHFCYYHEVQTTDCSPFSLDFPEVQVPLGAFGSSTSATYTDSAAPDIRSFSWHYEVSPAAATDLVSPETRVCFEWSTAFVDEGLGEGILGTPVTCVADVDCCMPGETCTPGRCREGACALEQAYPARFAEYELQFVGEFGESYAGAYYAANGGVSGGTPRFLDEEGCIPQEVLPPALLVHQFAGNSDGAMSLRVRLRSRLEDDSRSGYRVQYANVDATTPLDDETYEVLEFQLPSNSFELVQQGWRLDSSLGTPYLVPPEKLTVRSRALTPAINAATALGTLLHDPDHGHPGTVLPVLVGTGFQVRQTMGACASEADCPGIPTCQNGQCLHTFIDSQFNGNALEIGPEMAQASAPLCSTNADCTLVEKCLTPARAPCPVGGECYCHDVDQSHWKGLILHEAGHQLQGFTFGSVGTEIPYAFGCTDADVCPDPAGIDPRCACAHVGTANQQHCLQSAETFTDAFTEGFGHFNAARILNSRESPDQCVFPYYKEVLAPDQLGGVDCATAPAGVCLADAVSGLPKALPPVAIDCAIPFPLRDTLCPTLPAGSPETISLLATEHDFLQFFWSIYTRAPKLDMGSFSALMRTTCSGTPCGCINAQGTACACTDPGCDIPRDLSTCGSICEPIAHQLRWTAVTVDNPAGPGEVSLSDGAQRFFDSNLGAGNQQFPDFRDAAVLHGITPETLP